MPRPLVTQKVIDTFASVLDAQDEKGLEKYGVSIDEAKHEEYDWNVMALEEVADFTKYMVKENQKLRLEIQELRLEIEQRELQEKYLLLRLQKAEEKLGKSR